MDIFLKLVLDQFLLYRLYDHRIILESDENKLTYSPLYKISAEKLETTKQYLLENLNKFFIKASQISFVAFIYFAKKPNGNL
jgi:hypothetical protein